MKDQNERLALREENLKYINAVPGNIIGNNI